MARVKDGTLFPAAGEWCWAPSSDAPERIVLGLPLVGVVRLRIAQAPKTCADALQCWLWNGDLDTPTLEPSIRSDAGSEKWHGYLRAGRLVDC